MKILLVSNGFPPTAYGGVEIYTSTLAQNLVKKNHDVVVFCRESDPNREDYQVIRETYAGVNVIRVVNDYKRIRGLIDTYLDETVEQIFSDWLGKVNPEIVHFNHLIALSAKLPLIATGLGYPSVVTLHDYWPICHRVNLIDWHEFRCLGPQQGGICSRCVGGEKGEILLLKQKLRSYTPLFIRRFLRQFARSGDGLPPSLMSPQVVFDNRMELFLKSILVARKILVPSQFVGRMYVLNGYPEDKIEVSPLGVEYPQGSTQENRENKGITFGFVGSVIPIKGVDLLIRAFRSVNNPNIRLNLYGRDDIIPPYSTDLKMIAQDDPRIRFMGPFSPEQRDGIYQQVDVVVIPSIVPETFSIVAREALLMGKPVIASDIGALPEVIFHGVNGFLFRPGDVESLAWFLTQLANNPQMASDFDLPGPAKIPSVSEHTIQIETIYRDSIDNLG